MYRSALAGK